MNKKGLLIPISAPSGTGKTTVCRELMQKSEDYVFSISCTTRQPRKNEKNGKDYYFISEAKFKSYIQEDKLAEWEQVFDNFYGTLKSTLEDALAQGQLMLLDIDVKGALNIKKLYPERSFTIFLEPPSLEELKKRLTSRGTENGETIKKRNLRINEEMKFRDHFDFTIINDDLEETVNKIHETIKEKV
ncbi:MAG: guanylate kinase [Candidatus Marinimicrobia bacterium]|nr:guanylate kinase [Candidatus Neomarinimicrobiota bacterium]